MSVSEVLIFKPSVNVSRLCVMVDIVNDSVLEGEQTFFLVLSTADPTITVQEDPAVVLIMDNDGMCCAMLILLSNLVFVLDIHIRYTPILMCETTYFQVCDTPSMITSR